jgi:hypothetical protein
MTESRSVGQADWARLYLLLTALEEPVEDAGRTPEIALRELRQEHPAVLEVDGAPAAIPADQLLRQELHNGRRLLDALYAGRPLDGRALHRATRPYPSFRTHMSGR